MLKSNQPGEADFRLAQALCPKVLPETLPLVFTYGGKRITGIPGSFSPVVETQIVDSTLVQTVITGSRDGLEITARIQEYRDFPVMEWTVWFRNTDQTPSEILSDVSVIEHVFPGENGVFHHGNGDTTGYDGYELRDDPVVATPLEISPVDGTSCNGASPFMRLMFDDCGVNLAVGWPARWKATVRSVEGGVRYTAGQATTHMRILPGETLRTPSITLMVFKGDALRGANMWRQWYFRHILPREYGNALEPYLCLWTNGEDGGDWSSGTTTAGQLKALNRYQERGIKPDIWWIDAGWYPCNKDWHVTGTWTEDAQRFPDEGLAPIGHACDAEGIRFLLWFEPERVRHGTWLHERHPEWLLHARGWNENENRHLVPRAWILQNPSVNSLLDLGNPQACDWLIEHVDTLIKKWRIRVYRQDFNFDPRPFWRQNEAKDRQGALENLHVQGYLRFWDALLLRNPGLWIDSCASGGRRNDLETLRRSVPLHYTDVGYGNHPVRQNQHQMLYQWTPYFRAQTISWDNENRTYEPAANRAVDEYSYHVSMAPALTVMTPAFGPEQEFELAREMVPIWRRAAEIQLRADYFPHTKSRKSPEDYDVVQFHDPERNDGYVHFVRNTQAADESFTARLEVDPRTVYLLENPVSGEHKTCTGQSLRAGFTVSVPRRSGEIWFYSAVKKT